MFRDARTLLENTVEALEARKRSVDWEIADLERKLSHERERYEAAVAHWRAAGPEAILSQGEQALSRRQVRRVFWLAFLWGAAIPLVGNLFAFLAGAFR